MHNKKQYHYILLIVMILIIGSLACNAVVGKVATPTATFEPIPVKTEAVKTLESKVETAATEAAGNSKVTLEITETQLTSLIASELQKQQEQVVQNPQVHLQDGQVHLTGNVEQSGLSLPLDIVMTVSVDTEGHPHTHILSGSVGPFPLPQDLLDKLSTQLDDGLANQIDSENNGFFIEDITIDNGVMTVTGHSQK
jgi:uncharacterized protein YpmS